MSGSIIQSLAVLCMAWSALALRGATAGWVLIGLLVVFSLACGLCSVASKDVFGKTIPKTRRGQFNGISASLAGGIAVSAGALLLFNNSVESVTTYIYLFFTASVCWLVASVLYASVTEYRGATEGGANAIKEAWMRLALLHRDRRFRLFVIVRALLLCSALTAPYYVALAQKNIGYVSFLLGLFVIVDGCAAFVSAPFWGRFADRSARQVMIAAAAVTGCLGFITFLLLTLWPQAGRSIWLYPLLFFCYRLPIVVFDLAVTPTLLTSLGAIGARTMSPSVIR